MKGIGYPFQLTSRLGYWAFDMIFAVGGVPHLLFNRFQQLVEVTFGKGHIVIARPLQPAPDGRFVPAAKHAEELIRELFKRVAEDPSIASHGLGLIVLSTQGSEPRN